MSALLCRTEAVKHPYFVEFLGIRLFSSQELCYVIANNLLLVMEGFVGEGLLQFIGQELGMANVARKMRLLRESGAKDEELLLTFLSQCDYYTEEEQGEIRQQFYAYRKLPAFQYTKLRADALFVRGQYGKATRCYEEVLQMQENSSNPAFLMSIYQNLGSAYAQLFQFERAWAVLEEAYTLSASEAILRQLYFLTKFAEYVTVPQPILLRFTPTRRKTWDAQLEEARRQAKNAPDVVQLQSVFSRNPQRWKSLSGALLQEWKKEYRAML